jgi:hypothetical protein
VNSLVDRLISRGDQPTIFPDTLCTFRLVVALGVSTAVFRIFLRRVWTAGVVRIRLTLLESAKFTEMMDRYCDNIQSCQHLINLVKAVVSHI